LQHLQGVVSKLANRLQRRLLAQQQRAWDFDLDEGILDAGRLARIVANPLVAGIADRRQDLPGTLLVCASIAAAATLLLDALKGTAAILIVAHLLPGQEVVAAAAAFIGHCYPVWLRFKGGKGVATLMGICLGLSGPIALVYAIIWLGLLALVRISSVAGMLAAISAPVSAAAFGRLDLVAPLVGLAALVLWKHRANLDRLMKGTEPRIGKKHG
jgi:acyl-phosphate glycerol 3-phosphate acyltransferase